MEFNVLYLVKALLKKWYVILLVMAITVGAAVGLSKISYKKAVADYQQNLAIAQSENKKVLLTTRFSYRLDDASLNFLGEFVRENGGTYNKEDMLHVAKDSFNARLSAMLNDKSVMSEVAAKYEISEEELAEYLEVSAVDKETFSVSVTDLSEAQAKEMQKNYLAALQAKLENVFVSFRFEEHEGAITVTDEAAHFINAVMEEPSAPSLVRTVLTAALYGFAFACIGVLVYIFVKESKKEKEAEATNCEQQ